MPSSTSRVSAGSLILVPAALDDAGLTFTWRNHEATRSQAHDSRPLTADGHDQWWRAAVASPERHLLIAMEADMPVGVLRLDQTGMSAEVSIYLDPAQTGRGLGREILRAGILHARQTGIDTLVASIKDTNVASQSAFTAAGFVRSNDGWTCIVG
ncbi:MAG: N-acetyltransferase [Caulobacteraceae bacterium]|nr:MAG: N-acetyltransferase [Caulobacteraceae bacterium]